MCFSNIFALELLAVFLDESSNLWPLLILIPLFSLPFISACVRRGCAFSLTGSIQFGPTATITTTTTTATTIIKMWMALWRCYGCLIVCVCGFLFRFVSVCFRHLFIFITHVICYRYFQHRINKFLLLLGCLFVRSFVHFFLNALLLRLRCRRLNVSIGLSFFLLEHPFFSHRLSNTHKMFIANFIRLFLFFIHTECIWSKIQMKFRMVKC